MLNRSFISFSLVAVLLSTLFVRADDASKPVARIRPDGIDGSLVIVGGGKIPPAAMDRFIALAGGEKGKLVVIPSASEAADKEDAEKLLSSWKEKKLASVTLLHARSRDKANEPAFTEPLKQATAVWFGGGSQSRLANVYLGTKVETELYALLKRGGVIGGTSAGAAIMSKLMIASGTTEAKLGQGMDLLPGSVIDQHFLKRNRQPRLRAVIDKHSDYVGFGIDENTALIVNGRELRVLGESTVTIYLGRSKTHEPKTTELKAGAVADLTALRRAALDRAAGEFPPTKVVAPEVPNGSLVIVGGGGMPAEVTKKFIELAGGPDALIVVLPTANPDPLPMGPGEGGFFVKNGAKNVQTLRARDIKDVEDPQNLEVLKKAKAIWFGGGRQWRFVDAYENTKAEPLFHDVLTRGGVIGGSSAGATIQGDYLCRGSPLGNLEIMYEGYERGFAFLPGVAVDQHFTQRKRFGDMTSLVKTYPQYLGIGIDEATALIVKGHVAEIMGKNKAHFFNAKRKTENGKPNYDTVAPGEKYDLKERKVLNSASGAASAPRESMQ